MAGHQRHRQLLPNVGADILLGLADDLIFTVHGVGGLQLSGSGLLILPQQQQQQQLQSGHDHIAGEGIHPLLLLEHLLQQGYGILRGSDFAVEQGRQISQT